MGAAPSVIEHPNWQFQELENRLREAAEHEQRLRHEAETARRVAADRERKQQELLRQAETARRIAADREREQQEWLRAQREEAKRAEKAAQEAQQRELEARRRAEEAKQRQLEARKREEQAAKEAEEARQRELEAQQRELEAKRRAEEAKQRQLEARKREEQVAKEAEEARRRELEAGQRELEAKRRAEEAKQRQLEARKREEQVAKEAEEARQRELEARQRELQAAKGAEEAREALRLGITPVVSPTMEEIAAAKTRLEYRNDRYHFAVCGAAGSGKSSLINAFRGLAKSDVGAAEVGIVETTLQTSRYPDPRSEAPYSKFSWYDVPGAGTLNIPDWQYFNDQGLYIFDFIILLYDVRFTKIDIGILENCRRFRIPAFIVRSKADQHIRNMIKDDLDDDDSCSPKGERELFESAKSTFVRETREDLAKNLQRMQEDNDIGHEAQGSVSLGDQRVYIVSDGVLRRLFSASKATPPRWKLIDEKELITDLLSTAAQRSYRADGSKAADASLCNGLNSKLNKLAVG